MPYGENACVRYTIRFVQARVAVLLAVSSVLLRGIGNAY